MKPILSIVIANYNYGRFLEDAIRSVLLQNMGEEVELIICDASSTDNSVEIIRKYANGLPPNTSYFDWIASHPSSHISQHLISWWCSEKDGGQSAAFNKGFSHARGKYLTWLNADDVLVLGCLKKVVSEMEKHPDCEWFTGNFFRFLESDKTIMEIGWGPHIYPRWMQTKRAPLVIFGPTTFFSKKVYEQVGRINESMHFCMDNDLWYRFVQAGVKQRRVRCFCWAFRMHEASKTAEFGDHKMPQNLRDVAYPELAAMRKRLGIHRNIWFRLAIIIWRFVDGSIAVRAILKKRLMGKTMRMDSMEAVRS